MNTCSTIISSLSAKFLTLFLLLFLPFVGSSQNFVNGDFEINTAGVDQINLTNAAFNGFMSNIEGFGTNGNLDIVTSATYGAGPISGNWYCALTGGGTDVISMELTAPLVQGQTYDICFWYVQWNSFQAFPLEFGAATAPATVGTAVYTSPVPTQTWTQHTFSFVAPNNATHITVQGTSGTISNWIKIDGFTFGSCGLPPTADLVASNTTPCVGDCIDFTDLSSGGPTTWNWSFPGATPATSTAQNPTGICYNTPGTYDVTLTVTNANGTDDTTYTNYIVVNPCATPTADFVASNTTLCETDCIDFTDLSTGNPTSWTWTFTGGIPATSNVQNPTNICYNTAGTYDVTLSVTNGSGTHDTTFTNYITVNPQDNAAFTYPLTTYCVGDPDPTPTIAGTTGGTFTIDNGGVINPTTGVVDIAGSGGGTFVVTYTTTGLCPDTATFMITISVGGDATILSNAGPFCAGDPSVNLTAVDPGGTWTGTGITDAVAGTFDPSTAGAGSHTITYTIPGACGSTDNVTIVVNPQDDATFSYPNAFICINDPNPVATVTGTAGGTFTIDNGGVINSATGEVDLTATSSGTYNVTYTTTGICPATSTVSITIIDPITPIIDPAGPYCVNWSPDTLTVSALGGIWSGTGIDPATGAFNPALAGVGTHDIIYTIAGSCGGADTIQVIVSGLPTADAGLDTTIAVGGDATLTATGGTSYLWSPLDDLDCSTCPTVIANPLVTTTYWVTATNEFGCTDSDSVIVTVTNDFEVWVPNIFSPNASGHNDVFYVRGKGIASIEFYVFDRWGELVFETTELDTGWDGTIRGKPANGGVYVYLIRAYSYTSDEPKELKGNVTLVR